MYGNNQDMLCEAIKRHLTVRLSYENDINYRYVEPYAVFYSTTNKILVFAIQRKDESNPTKQSAPRNFEISKIRDVQLTLATFKPDIKFNIRNIDICKREICTINVLQVVKQTI